MGVLECHRPRFSSGDRFFIHGFQPVALQEFIYTEVLELKTDTEGWEFYSAIGPDFHRGADFLAVDFNPQLNKMLS